MWMGYGQTDSHHTMSHHGAAHCIYIMDGVKSLKLNLLGCKACVRFVVQLTLSCLMWMGYGQTHGTPHHATPRHATPRHGTARRVVYTQRTGVESSMPDLLGCEACVGVVVMYASFDEGFWSLLACYIYV